MATKKETPVQLGVLMSKKQIKIIDLAAKKIGLSRSAYVRHVLFTYILEK
jgi:ACT domain-containing protein